MDAERLRERLIGRLIAHGYLHDPRLAAAFRSVPRHLFLPGIPTDDAYDDEAIPTHLANGVPVSAASQPAIMAAMLEQLDVRAGDRVLEIGSGTGYNAALLAVLAGAEGRVTSVDIEPRFVAEARDHLLLAGFPAVEVVVADGLQGYRPNAPYDRIIVTAAASSVPDSWAEQLADSGRLVVPLAEPGNPRAQASTAFEKQGAGLRLLSRVPCGFMPLRKTATTTA